MYLGMDIGSTTSKAVLLDGSGSVMAKAVVDLGTGSSGPQRAVTAVLEQAGMEKAQLRRTVATGYGRMLFAGADRQITEISCHAKGVAQRAAEVHTIIDIGGQDAKVIRLGARGAVENFVMNEKCAAGTGRFLEVVARVLGCPLDELSDLAAEGRDGVTISSVCTVFAESEIISQLSEGKPQADVARGALQSIAKRITGLAGRIGIVEKVVMTGGAALNQTLVDLLEIELGRKLLRIEDPQLMGALGAAQYALEMEQK